MKKLLCSCLNIGPEDTIPPPQPPSPPPPPVTQEDVDEIRSIFEDIATSVFTREIDAAVAAVNWDKVEFAAELETNVRSIVATQLQSNIKNVVSAELDAKLKPLISGIDEKITKAVAAATAPPAGEQYAGAAQPRSLKEAILHNTPIDTHLHVIAVISNPCNFHRREQLMREFTARMEREPHVIFYIVELAYGNQQFRSTDAKNRRHLQLRAEVPLWHKENMINLGVYYLLPPNWRAMAWIDADIDFENAEWALDTLKVLNGYRDVVQLFSHAIDMDAAETTMNVYNSFGFQHDKGLPYTYKFPNYWHPGYAWAITRDAFEKMRAPGDQFSGVFELGILGASDHIMSFCYRGNGLASINDKYTQGFKDEITRFEARVRNLRLGYIPGVIRHYFHGSKANRKYVERNEILLRHHYEPARHLTRDASGVFIPTADFPHDFAREIYDYFLQRNEDEDFGGREPPPSK